MSFLSAALPGFREVRTPFAVGALWLASILLASHSAWERIASLDAVAAVGDIVKSLPVGAQTGALAFVAYLIGMLAGGFQAGAENRLVRFLFTRVTKRTNDRWWLPMLLRHPSARAEDLATVAMNERLRPISTTVSRYAPRALLLEEFDLAALRLSRDAGDQYQQYDRMRAEAELRRGIAPPLLVLTTMLALMLPTGTGLVVGPVGLVVSVAFFVQGQVRGHQADEYMASAIYFGYTSTPLFESLVTEATEDLPHGRQEARATDLAWLADFLDERSLLTQYTEFISKLRHPAGPHADLERALTMMRPSTRTAVDMLLISAEEPDASTSDDTGEGGLD